ncbi:MAG: RloB domain-containing protein [Caulobacteraceae bacterium]|nr:RloB domain-containing protein [Caulobacteraceae bacterium]
MLIVCEGAKTEPYYFEGLKRAWRLSNANVHVHSAGASDPLNIVAYALNQVRDGGYDRAFCVFDRDSHAGFQAALQQIAQSAEGQAGKLEAIVSWPCFEVWVLLHFVMTTKDFAPGAGRSACEQVIREIATHFPGYAKASKGIFDALGGRLDAALAHAEQLASHNLSTGAESPATSVHRLVAYLRGLKPQ